MEETPIKQNITQVWEAINKAKQGSILAVEEPCLVAVSKTKPQNLIHQALEAGQLVYGENKVQEAKEKWPALMEEFPEARLHLIGGLQTNKAREAINIFHAIHSLDSERLAEALTKEVQKKGSCPEMFIQVNTGEEPQKGGVVPAEADNLVKFTRNLGLNLVGLMCIPPEDAEPSLHFGLLRKIAERNGLDKLSMGMSGDFEKAVRMGATHIRIGTAIFGKRA